MSFIIFAKFCSIPHFLHDVFIIIFWILESQISPQVWAWMKSHFSSAELFISNCNKIPPLNQPGQPLEMGESSLPPKHMALWSQDKYLDKIEYPWEIEMDQKLFSLSKPILKNQSQNLKTVSKTQHFMTYTIATWCQNTLNFFSKYSNHHFSQT